MGDLVSYPNVSIWLGPPVIQSKMTDLRLDIGRPVSTASDRCRKQFGQGQAGNACESGFHHIATTQQTQPFACRSFETTKRRESCVRGHRSGGEACC